MGKLCNTEPTLDCLTCYETTKQSPCVATLLFDLDLTVGVSYYLWVVDKFYNVYREQVTVTAGGIITPNLANYPDSFFNENAGYFWCYLTTDIAGLNKVTFTLAGTSYKCFIFNIA